MQRRIVVLLVTFAFAWSGLAALYSQVPAPRIGCRIQPEKITTGGTATFEIFADQLPPLTAYTLTITYDDPFSVDFQDQISGGEINLLPSTLFAPDAVTVNVVDRAKGEIQIAASQPISSAMTGQYDVLASGKISGGSSALISFHFVAAALRDHNSLLIPDTSYARQECFVEIGDSLSPTPTRTATSANFSALVSPTPLPPGFTSVPPTITPTPTDSPTPTPGPTSPLPTPEVAATPTFTPIPTFTPVDTDTPVPTETPTETPTATHIDIETPTLQAQDVQSPLETPTADGAEASVIEDATQTPTDTPLPTATNTPTPEPITPTETPTPSQTPTQTPEPPTATPIVRPTATPVLQANRALSDTVQVVAQTSGPVRISQTQPYRLLGIAALFSGFALLLAFWQLRRKGRD
ncbi:MAG: hypothetical protein KF753_15950 [Caldilineaceae bacterium]|nr:hypothetical protein [Caldilineaceae bacterium]